MNKLWIKIFKKLIFFKKLSNNIKMHSIKEILKLINCKLN